MSSDSLAAEPGPGERYSMILTNPPFGKKSSIAIVNEDEVQSIVVGVEGG